MKLAMRIGMVVGAATIVLASVVPTWAQSNPAPVLRPGAGVAAGGPAAEAGVIAFTGADFLVGLVILATLIVFGWTALAAGQRRERASRRSPSSVLEVPPYVRSRAGSGPDPRRRWELQPSS
jgi:hypothetical protein